METDRTGSSGLYHHTIVYADIQLISRSSGHHHVTESLHHKALLLLTGFKPCAIDHRYLCVVSGNT